MLTRERILEALAALNEALATKGATGELCLFGGATMVLVFDARLATRDVDAVFVPKYEISSAAAKVAEDLNLPESWLNDGVKVFVSENGELTEEGMPQWSNLRILRPSTRYLLAMKCMASRVPGYDTGGDQADILTLSRHLGLTNAEEILNVVEAYYPVHLIPAKTSFLIEELAEELKRGNA